MTIEESFNLANRLYQDGQVTAAETLYRQILAQRANFAPAHFFLANSLKAQGRLDEAVRSYRTAVALQPDYAQAFNNLGNTLRSLAFGDEAREALRKATTLCPDDPAMQFNYANTLVDGGQIDQAIAAFTRAVALRPDYADAHFNLGVLLLYKGDYPAGWPEFEWRWKTSVLASAVVSGPQPQWQGEPLNGKRILIYADQSLGDTLNFVRYVPMVHERGGKIILACHGELHRLFASVCPIEQFVGAGEALTHYDVRCAMMSLPRIFGTTLANIPNKTPYLFADADRGKYFRGKMPADDRLKVGLVWAGTPNPLGRSIPAELLAPLAKAPNIWFCSLQKWAHRMDDVQRTLPPLELADWTSELNDFADTAALIDNLDLVISIDTATAHLAGAMGKRTWVLLKTFPDWRWMAQRADSPWYPGMRLFRQVRGGDWKMPINQVLEGLIRGQGKPT